MPTTSGVIQYNKETGYWYNEIGKMTNPVGALGTGTTSIWDNAYGTSSGAIMNYLNAREGSNNIWGDDPTDVQRAMRSERNVEEYVRGLSNASCHGWIQNEDDGDKFDFQFNPEKFQYTRGALYADNIAPGMCYPKVQFVSGQVREFDVNLFMYDRPIEPCGIIKNAIPWFGKFLTPETNADWYHRPPTMIFCYGFWVRRCVMTNLDIEITEMDRDGTPTQANFVLTLKQVGVLS